MFEHRETADLWQSTHTGRDTSKDADPTSTSCAPALTWDLKRHEDGVELMIADGPDKAFKVNLNPRTALAMSSALSYFATS